MVESKGNRSGWEGGKERERAGSGKIDGLRHMRQSHPSLLCTSCFFCLGLYVILLKKESSVSYLSERETSSEVS